MSVNMSSQCIKMLGLGLIFCFTTSTYIKAVNNKTEASKEKQNYIPSTISLSYSPNTVCLSTKENSFCLPKVQIQYTNLDWITSDNKLTHSPIGEEAIKALKKDYEELDILSNKLGVEVKDIKHINLYREAANWLGTRYRWAGKSKKGVDCSGLTGILMKEVYNTEVDRSSYIIARNISEELEVEKLSPGDLVFFSTRSSRRKSGINHVGVYLGNRRFIHASRRQGVVVSSLDEAYYSRTFIKGGRL